MCDSAYILFATIVNSKFKNHVYILLLRFIALFRRNAGVCKNSCYSINEPEDFFLLFFFAYKRI